jgi:outer membrane protein assembly factor BamB
MGRSCDSIGALLTKHLNTSQSIQGSFPPPGDARSFPGRGRGTQFFVQAGLCLWLLVCFSVAAMAQVNVYTRSYDTSRTGANLQETILTPANVNSTSFGKLFTFHTDGEIFAQPLYVSKLAIAGGTHNVVFVASMLNTIYALDADTGTQLWSQNFGSPIIPQNVQNQQNISYATGLGILGTPVIDPTTNIMYFVSGSQPASGAAQYSFNLNAIEIATGLPVSGSPVAIAATYSTADLTTPLVFSAQTQNPRPGLALANGNVYIAFASHNDIAPYNGWVLAYSTSTLAQTAVYSDTTTGTLGGIWNSGQAPTVDAAGNLYISTGNGSFGTTPNQLVQTGNSFIKLSPTLQLLDYFTPYNSAVMNSGDMDLGSSGLLLIPNTNYVLGGGKQGVLYLVDTTAMGEFNVSSDNVRQEFQAVYGVGTSHLHGGAVYLNSDVNGPSTYVWGENDVLRGFLFNATTGLLTTTPFASSTITAPATNNDGAMPGGFLSISANGSSNGIVWASTPYNGDASNQNVQGVLYAFNADTLSLLWSDKTNDARDEIGMFAKYVPPVVANGKVYVPNFGPVGNTDGSGNLVVYGLLQPLTVTANNATRAYGTANPTFAGTVTGAQNGDTFTESFATTATTTSAVGSYPIVPSVTGSNLSNYTVTVANGTLTVTAAATTTTLTAPGSAASGASETLTATVASAAGAPGGTVTFSSGSTALGTDTLNGSGVATLTTTTLPVGTDTVTATYAAAGNFAASASAPVTITVTAAPVTPAGSYTVSANPTSLTVGAGQAATTTLTFTPTGGYSGTIALSCSNLPTNASCAFAQKQVTLSGNNQAVSVALNITTAQQAEKHAPQSALNPTWFALVFWWPGGLTGLAVVLRKRTLVKTRPSLQFYLLLVSTCALAAGLSSCGTSGNANGNVSGTTTSQVTVMATGTSGAVVSTQTVALTLNMAQ